MDDLTIEEVKQLVNFYKQRSSDLEFSNLQLQLKYGRLVAANNQSVSATKVSKSKSE